MLNAARGSTPQKLNGKSALIRDAPVRLEPLATVVHAPSQAEFGRHGQPALGQPGKYNNKRLNPPEMNPFLSCQANPNSKGLLQLSPMEFHLDIPTAKGSCVLVT